MCVWGGESGEESYHLQLFKKTLLLLGRPFLGSRGSPWCAVGVAGGQAGVWGQAFRAALPAQASFRGDMGGEGGWASTGVDPTSSPLPNPSAPCLCRWVSPPSHPGLGFPDGLCLPISLPIVLIPSKKERL